MDYDLIIRGGTIVDGSGAKPYAGDVAVKGGRIAAVGKVEGSAKEVIDAEDMLVTPGFVDVHTHYDGQAIWSERLLPSSCHGVTTAVVGNCGVGFAPCRASDQAMLIKAMEGVEDIPGIVLNEGLSWDWETFPQYLDALDKRPRDIDVAAYLPHSALRLYVMGERGAEREPATADDIETMKALAREAMKAGAIGFSTSRIHTHRRSDGELIPSFGAATEELVGIAGEAAKGGGIFQIVPELTESGNSDEARAAFDLLCEISRRAGVHLSFSIAQMSRTPELLPVILGWAAEANAEGKASLSAQTYPRPIGLVMGWDLTAHSFVSCPSYKALADLPLAERLAELRRPEVRARLLVEEPQGEDKGAPLTYLSHAFDRMFALGPNPNYEPGLDESVGAIARRRGVSGEEVAYDLMMADDGHGKLMVAVSNYAHGSLEFLRDVLSRPEVVVGLGDGGAHYGLVCDASYPTFMLTHWGRDRAGARIEVAELVRMLTSRPAELMGFADRGRLAAGLKADINVIDFDRLALEAPTVVHDLPGGNRRLMQGTRGFKATIVSGTPILRDDRPTGALPGRLVRGRRAAAGMTPAGKGRLMFAEVKKLQTFVAIVEEGSFTAAAEKLHIAQPWVSVQLRQLEDMLGLSLMERQRGKLVRLTADGREFLEIARKMLAACSEATGEFSALRNRDRKQLVLGVDPITLYMPGRNELITEFMGRHKDIDSQIVSRTPSELFAGLRNLEFDLILTSHPDPAEEIELLPLYQYNLRLMVPKASAPLYEPSRRGSLAGAQILTLPDSYHPGLYDWLRSTLGPLGVKWMQCPEDSFPALIRYAAMLGIAVLAPDFGDRSPLMQSEMEVRPIGGTPLRVQWGLIRRNGVCKTAAEAFWRMALPRAIGEARVQEPALRGELVDA